MVRLKEIIKTENIIKIQAGETLASALSKLATSHDGCFVFSSDNKYLGMINPYYAIIKASYPSNAKVEHCLFHAPRVKINTPINKIAQFFMESKVHYLPVFNLQDEFIGIISARRLLSSFSHSPIFQTSIKDYLLNKKKKLTTIGEDELISQALALFREKKISKLVVVSSKFKLKGILSYYDLISFLISPKTSPHRGIRMGDKVHFSHFHVKNFAKTYILTLTEKNLISDALTLILEKKIGSVVIVDGERHPVGVITTKDLLGFFLNLKNQEKVEISLKNLSKRNRQILGGFFNRFNLLLRKEPEVTKARLFVKEEKRGGLFEAVLSLFPKKGKPKVIKKEGRNLVNVLQPLIKIFKREK